MTDGTDPIHVLLVSPSADDAAPLARALAGAAPGAIRAGRAPGLDDAIERIAAESFDAVLLDLDAARDQGLATLVRLRAGAPQLPIVVVAGPDQEALAMKTVQVGAQDYLLKPQVHATLLARCLRHAVERFRLLDELERRAREWEDARRVETTIDGFASITGRVYGGSALSEALPDAFAGLVHDYGQILDDALEQRAYRVQHRVAERLRTLADELGFLRAGPRDVVEIHTDALRSREPGTTHRRFEAYVSEGRILIIELMGNLVAFYRRYSLAARPVRPGVPDVPREDMARE